jgi:hypothetical protein
MELSTIKHTVKVSSATGADWCAQCGKSISAFREDVALFINHMIQEHGYTLLHIGSEADHDNEGKTTHHTVAILGTESVPPPQTDTLENYMANRKNNNATG